MSWFLLAVFAIVANVCGAILSVVYGVKLLSTGHEEIGTACILVGIGIACAVVFIVHYYTHRGRVDDDGDLCTNSAVGDKKCAVVNTTLM